MYNMASPAIRVCPQWTRLPRQYLPALTTPFAQSETVRLATKTNEHLDTALEKP